MVHFDFHDRRNRVWRRPNMSVNVLQHARCGGGFIIVWGGITMSGWAPYCPPQPTQNNTVGTTSLHHLRYSNIYTITIPLGLLALIPCTIVMQTNTTSVPFSDISNRTTSALNKVVHITLFCTLYIYGQIKIIMSSFKGTSCYCLGNSWINGIAERLRTTVTWCPGNYYDRCGDNSVMTVYRKGKAGPVTFEIIFISLPLSWLCLKYNSQTYIRRHQFFSIWITIYIKMTWGSYNLYC